MCFPFQLCRRDIALHALQLGSDGSADALGMVPDTDTIGRLCEMTGGGLLTPKLLRSLSRIPAPLLQDAAAGNSYNGSSAGSLGSGATGSAGTSLGGGGSHGQGSGRPHLNSDGSLASYQTLRGAESVTELSITALHQSMLFRLSPLSRVAEAYGSLSPQPSFKLILGRRPAERLVSPSPNTVFFHLYFI